MKKNRFWWGFSLILLLAILMRFYQLGKIPVALYWDEVAMLVDAKVLAQTGYDMHGHSGWQVLFPSYGDYKLPVYIWLATLSVKLLGASELAVRLPSALAGVATIVVAGSLARLLLPSLSKRHKDWWQLLAMLVMAINPWPIMFSRTGFEGHLGQLLLTISIWVVFQVRAKKQNWLVWLSPVLGSLATYTYFSVRFVWPVVFLISAWLVWREKLWRWVLPAGLIYFALLWPMLRSPLYEASNQFRFSTSSILNAYDYPVESNQYRQLAGNTLLDRVLFHRQWLMCRELLKNYGDNLSLKYLFVNGDPNLRHGTGAHGLFLLIFAPFLLIGLYQLFNRHKPTLLLLTVWWLVALLPASVPETTPHALRSLNALVPLILIIAFGLSRVFFSWAEQKQVWLVAGVILLISLSVVEFSYHYLTQYPVDSAHEWQAGYKDLALEIDRLLPSVADVYLEEFDDRFYLWLLAYGHWTPAEIQALPKENYQLQRLDKITFSQFHWSKLDSLDRKILSVGLRPHLEEAIDAYDIKLLWQQDITQADGEAPFKIMLLEGPQR